MTTRPRDALDGIGLTPVNRVCYWIIMGFGLLILADAGVAMASGEPLQWIRHPLGLVSVLAMAAAYAKAVRLAREALERVGSSNLEALLPVGMDEAGRARLLGAIRWERPARAYVLFGRKAMERAFQKEFARSVGSL